MNRKSRKKSRKREKTKKNTKSYAAYHRVQCKKEGCFASCARHTGVDVNFRQINTYFIHRMINKHVQFFTLNTMSWRGVAMAFLKFFFVPFLLLDRYKLCSIVTIFFLNEICRTCSELPLIFFVKAVPRKSKFWKSYHGANIKIQFSSDMRDIQI